MLVQIVTAAGLAFVLLVARPGTAAPIVIDFDPTLGVVPSYTESGVTFAALFGNICGNCTPFILTPNGTSGITQEDSCCFVTPIRADIAGGASFVSIDIGDYNADFDFILLEAYNASDLLLASTSFVLPAPFVGMHTLALSDPGIAYVLFMGWGVGGTGNVYYDNFTFEAPSDVPEPSPLSLFVIAVAAVEVCRRLRVRRKETI